MRTKSFDNYKIDMIKVAKELRYSDKLIQKIRNAKTEYEISRIMASGRKEIE